MLDTKGGHKQVPLKKEIVNYKRGYARPGFIGDQNFPSTKIYTDLFFERTKSALAKPRLEI